MARSILVGTRKGLFFIRAGELSEPELTGWSVFHAVTDPRDGSGLTWAPVAGRAAES